MGDDGDNNDIEPLIFDLEEIECSMSDIDERNKTQWRQSKLVGSDEINDRGSVIHTPKDFPVINPSGKIQECSSSISNMSYQNLINFEDN